MTDDADAVRVSSRSGRFVAINLVAGPPIAIVTLSAFFFVGQLGQTHYGSSLPFDLLSFIRGVMGELFLSYLFGFIPAIVHALIMIGLGRVMRSRAAWAIAVPVSGFIASALFFVLFRAFYWTLDPLPPLAWWTSAGQFGLIGIAPAIGCALLARWRDSLPALRR